MMSNDALIQSWDSWMRARNLADKTRTDYRYVLTRFLSHLTPAKQVGEVTETDVVVYLTVHVTRGQMKAQTMKGLHSFFGWAITNPESGVERDPTVGLNPKAPSPPPPDEYTLGEIVALFHAAETQGTRRADALKVIYGLGLRRIELCRLRPSDIDWAGDRVAVQGKGGRVRWIPMTGLARDALRRLCRVRPDADLVVGVTPGCLTVWADEAAQAAGIKKPWRSLHILRRSYATHLRRNGVDIAIIQRLLGHSNLAVTDRYFSVNEQEKAAAVLLLTTGGE